MIKCKIKNKIVYIDVEGGFSYGKFEKELEKIMNSGEKYIGFISRGDFLEHTDSSVYKKCSDHHKKYHPNLPNACLLNNKAKVILGNIYIHVTGEINTKMFTDKKEAINWIKNFNK